MGVSFRVILGVNLRVNFGVILGACLAAHQVPLRFEKLQVSASRSATLFSASVADAVLICMLMAGRGVTRRPLLDANEAAVPALHKKNGCHNPWYSTEIFY